MSLSRTGAAIHSSLWLSALPRRHRRSSHECDTQAGCHEPAWGQVHVQAAGQGELLFSVIGLDLGLTGQV